MPPQIRDMIENNIELLIRIILSLIISLAFWSTYDIAIKKDGNKVPAPSYWVVATMVLGLFSIVLLFISYTNPLLNLIRFMGYSFFTLFILSFLQMLIGGIGGLKEIIGDLRKYKSTLGIIVLWLLISILILVFIFG